MLAQTDILVARRRTEDDADLEPRNRGVTQRIHATADSVDDPPSLATDHRLARRLETVCRYM